MEGMQEFTIEYIGTGESQILKGPSYEYLFGKGSKVTTRITSAAMRAGKYPELFKVTDGEGKVIKVQNTRRVLSNMRRAKQKIKMAAQEAEKKMKAKMGVERATRKRGIEQLPTLQSERIQVDVDEVETAEGKVAEQPPPDGGPICTICKREFKSVQGLNHHTRLKHHTEPMDVKGPEDGDSS